MRRRRWVAVPVILLLILTGLYAWSRPAAPPAPRASDGSLRIVTANVRFSGGDAIATAERLAALEPDVLLVLEWTGVNVALEPLWTAGLRPVAAESQRGPHGFMLLVLDSIAVTADVVPSPVPGPCRMPLVTAHLELPDDSLDLIGLHAPPPLAACEGTGEPTLEAIASWIEQGRSASDVGALVRGTRVIVLGDFNTLPFSDVLDAFTASGLADAYAGASGRLGPTWSPFDVIPALARIDYIFVPEHTAVTDAFTAAIPGSDHRAVAADVPIGVPERGSP